MVELGAVVAEIATCCLGFRELGRLLQTNRQRHSAENLAIQTQFDERAIWTHFQIE
jgi:hypothetical protein